ncbi:hypothetical protein PUV44_08560 [Xanthomonas arboricola pv. corylina]|nr:hypothetical protein PUV44_08560 [Xanthomonas arboricola pv. corylina]
MKKVVSDDAFQAGVDMVFSDFNHSPESIQALLSAFLPVMRETSSVFIDSASTHRLSYLALERIVEHLNQGRLPAGLAKGLNEDQIQHVEGRSGDLRFASCISSKPTIAHRTAQLG